MNKLLKSLLFLFVLSVSIPSFGQLNSLNETGEYIDMREVRKKQKFNQNKFFSNSHEFSLGVDLSSINISHCSYAGCCRNSSGFGCVHTDREFTGDYYDKLLYDSRDYRNMAFSFGYKYNITSFISVGATFTYAGFNHEDYHRITKETLRQGYNHNFSITPMVSFTYFRNQLVRVYGEVGLGIGGNLHNIKEIGQDYKSDKSQYDSFMTYQVTWAGVSIGRKFFGFAEMGIGTKGLIIIGFGYKFKSYKK